MSLSQKQNRYKKLSNLMETNIIAQKFASFNVCVYLSTQIWGSKVCPSVLFWVKWFRWKTGWFSSLLKLLHMFTHETGSLLQRYRAPPHCLTHVRGRSLRGENSKHKTYCFFNSILKWNCSFPPCWVVTLSWFTLKDHHIYAHTAFIHSNKEK